MKCIKVVVVLLFVSLASARTPASRKFLNAVRSDLMYPVAKEDKLDISDSKRQIQMDLDFDLPFYGFRYNFTRVSLNGYLEFTDGPDDYTHYPLEFPRDYPCEKDPSFIGPFFSKMRIGSSVSNDGLDNGVYFRQESKLSTRNEKAAVELKQRVKKDIQEGAIFGAQNFEPENIIIVTWKGMSFRGGIESSKKITNTFQVLVATDENKTFTIFNYQDINWTSHTEAGGDAVHGEDGVSAYVGFNAGKKINAFEYYPYSQRYAVRDLAKTGCTNGLSGRHIFKIDSKIVPGTCTNNIDYICKLYNEQN